MSVNKYNSEGYYDPTVYEALTAIEREAKRTPFRPLIYVCSPYAGDVESNIRRAREYCRFAVSMNTIPLASHLLFPQFLDDKVQSQRELGLFMGFVLMGKCQEVWCFGDRISTGMKLELAKAKQRGMRIRYFDAQCREVKRDA